MWSIQFISFNIIYDKWNIIRISNEKNERQNTQDYLINLLEDMCTKITQANDII